MNVRISGIASSVAHSTVHVPSLPVSLNVRLTGYRAVKKAAIYFCYSFTNETFLILHCSFYTADID